MRVNRLTLSLYEGICINRPSLLSTEVGLRKMAEEALGRMSGKDGGELSKIDESGLLKN